MTVATISSKGQITIPKAVRDKFSLGPGDKIEFFTTSEQVIFLPKTVDVSVLKGIVPCKKPVSLETIEKGIIEGAVKSGLGA